MSEQESSENTAKIDKLLDLLEVLINKLEYIESSTESFKHEVHNDIEQLRKDLYIDKK